MVTLTLTRSNRRGEPHNSSWCIHPKKNEEKNHAENPKSDKDTAVPQEKELAYGIDSQNLGDPVV